jgi:hypothetical protein
VVATDEVDAVWVPEFEADEEGYRFDAEETAVDIIACGTAVSLGNGVRWQGAKVGTCRVTIL